MKTQEEINAVRAAYKKQWDVDVKRMEGKLAYHQAFLDTLGQAWDNGLTVDLLPGEIIPGDLSRREVAMLKENIAYRALQWELIQDEFDACDKARAS